MFYIYLLQMCLYIFIENCIYKVYYIFCKSLKKVEIKYQNKY